MCCMYGRHVLCVWVMCCMYGGQDCIQGMVGKLEGNHLEYLGIDGTVVSKWILK
jgi:hypothetical protein